MCESFSDTPAAPHTTTIMSTPLTRLTKSHFIEGYWKESQPESWPPPCAWMLPPFLPRATWPDYPEFEPFRGLPHPVPQGSGVDAAFLDKLATVELYAYRVGFLGHSECRLCDKTENGCGEYSIKSGDLTFTFPEGLRHYYEEHNLHPSPEFRDFVETFQPPSPEEFLANLKTTDIINIFRVIRMGQLYPEAIAQTLRDPAFGKRLRDQKIREDFLKLTSGLARLRYST